MKKICIALAALAFCGSLAGQSKAFDPAYGFGYGSVFGPTFQFRNRLPTPPYFAIYPPVYYGERYQRPYGASPFAALPMVHAGDDYRVQLKTDHATLPSAHCPACATRMQTTVSESVIAVETGKSTWIDNPYVVDDSQIARK